MSKEAKRPAKKTAAKPAISKPVPMMDVAHPGTSAPPDTSKPIITPRPIIKDPMVLEDDQDKPDTGKALSSKGSTKPRIEPLAEEPAKNTPEEPSEEPVAAPPSDKEDQPEEPDKSDDQPDKADQPAKETDEDAKDAGKEADAAKDKKAESEDSAAAAAAAQAEADAKIQQLIESKKYYLPLNAVEHRRSARFAAVGILLALILAAAWVDVALDAGLIHLGGIKPVTHLFSN